MFEPSMCFLAPAEVIFKVILILILFLFLDTSALTCYCFSFLTQENVLKGEWHSPTRGGIDPRRSLEGGVGEGVRRRDDSLATLRDWLVMDCLECRAIMSDYPYDWIVPDWALFLS